MASEPRFYPGELEQFYDRVAAVLGFEGNDAEMLAQEVERLREERDEARAEVECLYAAIEDRALRETRDA